jgi:hypothetical protein
MIPLLRIIYIGVMAILVVSGLIAWFCLTLDVGSKIALIAIGIFGIVAVRLAVLIIIFT